MKTPQQIAAETVKRHVGQDAERLTAAHVTIIAVAAVRADREQQSQARAAEPITPDIAAHALYWYGDYFNGTKPGGFTMQLLGAISRADARNRERLRNGYPAEVLAMGLAANHPGGMDRLRDIARAR